MEALLDLLLNQEKTLDIIQNLSIYVIYFYPGTISLYVMNFLEAKSLKEDTAYVVKIFAVSYLYNLALGRFIAYKDNMLLYNIIVIAISFIMPLLVFKIKFSKWFSSVCLAIGIRTCMTGVPFELIKSNGEEYSCVNVYLKDKYVVLEVKDNGIGVPITMQQKIFERFVQLDKSLSRKKEGSGIGLSLVKILVEIHNGYIELESKEGNGSIFRVYLPNENDNSMIKVKSCNEYNVNIERVYAELSDIYELI